MQNIFKKIAACAISVIVMAQLAGCSHPNEWTVSGRIEGADGETMVLEASNNGVWYPLDSVTLDMAGNFSLSQAAAPYPDIYRLRLGDKTLYFPIDSIETVTVIANSNSFDTDYTLEGSSSAEKLMAVDRSVMDVANRLGVGAISTDSMLKRRLGGIVLDDRAGIVSYYIVSKKIGGVPVFDPSDKNDLRIIGAVANAFTEIRPDDPRTTYLKRLYLNHRPTSASAVADTIHANEINHFDITLYDNVGREHSLSSLLGHGHVVVLNFTAYEADASPAFNRVLHAAYQKYHDRGLEIYQVSVDNDEYAWKQAAKNLPWITVYNPAATGGRNLTNYNVTNIPTTYILNREGEISERVDDITRLDEALAKYF